MPLCYSAIPSRSLRRDGADLKGFGISQQAFCRAKFAFAQQSGAMKAPVGLLSDRTVLRSKMEGPRPDKFRHDAQNADNARKNTAFPPVCKKCAKVCRRAKQSPMDKSTTGFMAGFRTSEQTPFDIEMRFTMNKLLFCRH